MMMEIWPQVTLVKVVHFFVWLISSAMMIVIQMSVQTGVAAVESPRRQVVALSSVRMVPR